MDYAHLDAANAMAERMKRELRDIEAEEENLKRELSRLEGKRQLILKQLGEFTDDRYEEDMLTMVYEQRRGKRP